MLKLQRRLLRRLEVRISFGKCTTCCTNIKKLLKKLISVKYAFNLGLDLPRFESELANHTYSERVREDFRSGIMSGVNGTPTFYINGKRYDGSWDEEVLLTNIIQQINSNAQPKRKGNHRQ